MAMWQPATRYFQPMLAFFRQRLVLAYALACLLPIALVAALALLQTLNAYRANDELRLRDTARAVASAVNAELRGYALVLHTLSLSMRDESAIERERFDRRATLVSQALGGWVMLLGPNQADPPQLSTLAQPEGQNLPIDLPIDVRAALALPMAEVFATARPAVTNLFTNPATGRPGLALVAPVERDGRVVRVLVLGFQPAALLPLLQQEARSDGTYMGIADGQRRILASSLDPEGQFVGRPATGLVEADASGEAQLPTTALGRSGQPAYFAPERLAIAPAWRVVVAQPRAEQSAAAWRAISSLLLGLAALALAVGGLLLELRRREAVTRERHAAALAASRAEIERLHAGLPAIIFLRAIAPDGTSRLLYRSGDIAAVTGWPLAALEHIPDLADLAVPESRAAIVEGYHQGMREGVATTDWRLRRPDGSLATMRTFGRVLDRQPDGSATGVGYILDVTKEAEAQAQLAATSQQLEQTLASAPVAVFRLRVTPDGEFTRTYLSRGIEQVTGWPWEVINPQYGLRDILSPEVQDDLRPRFRRLLSQSHATAEYRLRQPDGAWRWVRETTTVLARLPDGSADVVGYLIDISAEHEAREREKEASYELATVLAELPAIAYRGEVAPNGAYTQIYINPSAARVTGWPQAELAADTSGALHVPVDYQPALLALRRRAREAGEVVLDYPFIRPDGTQLWVRDRLRRVALGADGTAEVIGTLVDITTEHRMVSAQLDFRALPGAEAAVQPQGEVDLLLAYAPAVLYINRIRPNGGYERIFLSRSAEAVTGWPNEVLSRSSGLANFTAPEDVPRREAFFRQVLTEGQGSFDYRMRRPDGGWRWCRANGRVIRYEPTGSALMVGTIVDISTERAAEARAVAAARLASLGEMSASLAHELKQPLQVISLSAENARLQATHHQDAALDRRLGFIASHAQRAGRIIDHLRRFARGAEEGVPPSAVSLETVVEGALMLVGSEMREAGIIIEQALGTPPPVVLGFPVALEQVLTNLLMNARDAMANLPGDQPRHIRIAARPGPGPGTASLIVADTAGGIPPAVMARLFEPFVTTKDVEKGTGLGLSICHGLVRTMQGSIKAENRDGGACFTITLPVAPG